MNYAALSVDELRARCIVDAGARAYAGEHFAELLERFEEEQREEQEANDWPGYGLDHALTWDHDNIPADSMWWTI